MCVGSQYLYRRLNNCSNWYLLFYLTISLLFSGGGRGAGCLFGMGGESFGGDGGRKLGGRGLGGRGMGLLEGRRGGRGGRVGMLPFAAT